MQSERRLIRARRKPGKEGGDPALGEHCEATAQQDTDQEGEKGVAYLGNPQRS